MMPEVPTESDLVKLDAKLENGEPVPANFEVSNEQRVAIFLYLIEDLEDYQIEPLRSEITHLYSEIERLMVKGDDAIIGGAKVSVAQKILNKDLISLRVKTRKSVKAILDKKQRKQFNQLLLKVIPRIPDDSPSSINAVQGRIMSLKYRKLLHQN